MFFSLVRSTIHPDVQLPRTSNTYKKCCRVLRCVTGKDVWSLFQMVKLWEKQSAVTYHSHSHSLSCMVCTHRRWEFWDQPVKKIRWSITSTPVQQLEANTLHYAARKSASVSQKRDTDQGSDARHRLSQENSGMSGWILTFWKPIVTWNVMWLRCWQSRLKALYYLSLLSGHFLPLTSFC